MVREERDVPAGDADRGEPPGMRRREAVAQQVGRAQRLVDIVNAGDAGLLAQALDEPVVPR
jgi:hypothetical protein